MQKVKVGLVGFGTIGKGVASYLLESNSIIREKTNSGKQ